MRRALVVGLVVVLLLQAFTGVAAAQQQQVGGTLVVDDGETVNGFTGYAGTIVVRGTVQGDLTAFAGRVVIEEGGVVTGRVRAFAGSVVIGGTVEQNTVTYAGKTTVTESARLGGSFGAIGGGASIAGTVNGDATAVTGAATLESSADVNGFLIHVGSLTDRGGNVRLGIRSASELALVPSLTGATGVFFGLYLLVADAFVGSALLYLFPGFARDVVETASEEPQQIALAGIVAAVAVPAVAAIAAITVVGLPLALALAVLFLVLVWLGTIYGRYMVGYGVVSAADRANPYLGLVVGILLVAVLSRLPFIGPILRGLVALLGVGALALGVYGAYELVRENRGSGVSV